MTTVVVTIGGEMVILYNFIAFIFCSYLLAYNMMYNTYGEMASNTKW